MHGDPEPEAALFHAQDGRFVRAIAGVTPRSRSLELDITIEEEELQILAAFRKHLKIDFRVGPGSTGEDRAGQVRVKALKRRIKPNAAWRNSCTRSACSSGW